MTISPDSRPTPATGTPADKGRSFHRMHDGPDPLVLPNAWDMSSGALLAAAGFAAVGTSSLGVAAVAGVADASGATKAETMALARGLASRLTVPVTVDVEAGFGTDPVELAAELASYGVAGVNIEDGRGDHLADRAELTAAIAGLKRGAPELFVNARVDTHWIGVSVEETRPRAVAYADAGADGVFAPGLTDEAEIARLVHAVDVPVNLLSQLPLDRLRDLGVRRVSTGSLLFRVALQAAGAAAETVRGGGQVTGAPSFAEIDALSRIGGGDQPVAAAAARPAARPENRQPPRKVPSSDR